jgi:carbonic anhydrase
MVFMKRFMVIVVVTTLLLFTLGHSGIEASFRTNTHNPAEQISDWTKSLQFLKDGNKRYIENRLTKKNTYTRDRAVLSGGQKPFAIILTCADSRVAPEIYFDQKLGNIFVIRNAGNIADATALGSIEFAVGALKAPLIVVVGHSKCGAVAGAMAGGEYWTNLQTVIDAITPNVRGISDLDKAALANVDAMCEKIKANAVVKENGAVVLGAYYDITTGVVSFR